VTSSFDASSRASLDDESNHHARCRRGRRARGPDARAPIRSTRSLGIDARVVRAARVVDDARVVREKFKPSSPSPSTSSRPAGRARGERGARER